MRRTAAALLLLTGCDRVAEQPAGERLEQAAIAAGLVADPAREPMTGLWARDSDRLCVIGDRAGVSLDYGEGQRCVGRGTAERRGEAVRLRFGDCRFEARFEGDRIAFPGEIPAACDRLCSGRAALAGVEVDRVSASSAEAAALHDPDGKPLCGG